VPVVDASENAVSSPVLQPAGKRVADVVGLKVERPGFVLAQISADALDQTPPVTAGCLDQQSYVGSLSHRGILSSEDTHCHRSKARSGAEKLESVAENME
jgi:hypothetical protein